MEETNRKLDSMDEKLEDLQKFKMEMMISAKWVSLVVSSVCGAITLIVSAYLTHWLK
jgi:hypothetical protein